MKYHSRRSFLAALALVLALVVLLFLALTQVSRPLIDAGNEGSVTLEAASSKIAILHTNDIHGYFMAAEPSDNSDGVIGLAAVAQLKKDYEEQGYSVLLLDDGDATQDNVLVNLSQGKSAIDFMNAAGYDAMTLGNHEFDWGVDNLEDLMAYADFPVLAANITVDANGYELAESNTVFVFESGAKVGVFGLATPETQTKASPKHVAGLSFAAGTDLYQIAQEQTDELRSQECDLVICLGHLGSKGGAEPNRSLDVLEHTQGIDLFIDGHDHEVVNEVVNGTLLVSTGAHLANIGLVLYEDGVLSDHMIAYGDYEGVDPTVEALIAQINDEVAEQLSEVIGKTEVALNGEREPGVRTEETNLGNFAADAMLWQATQASDEVVDAAIVNGGSIRASIDTGDISMATMMTVFPYNNGLNVVTLTGAELLEVLEAATFSLPEASGSFPQVASITYTVDTTIPYENGEAFPDSTYFAPASPGARVSISDVGGRGFSLDDTYAIATSSFVTDGGDTFYSVAAAYQETGFTTGYSDTDALINFIKTELGGVISETYLSPQGRITIR